MAKIELKIIKVGANACVSIGINAAECAQPLEFKNLAMAGIKSADDPVSPQLPYLTYKAIESACISGAIYARRKLKLQGLSVELMSFSWAGNVENAEPFAVAVMLAAHKAFPQNITFTDTELNGWSLAS
jgi:hypothetical protein